VGGSNVNKVLSCMGRHFTSFLMILAFYDRKKTCKFANCNEATLLT
jgi:hypothetical protein